jgi:hypothetical protein
MSWSSGYFDRQASALGAFDPETTAGGAFDRELAADASGTAPASTGTGAVTYGQYTAAGTGFSLVTGTGAVTYGTYTAAGTGFSLVTGAGAVTYGQYTAAGTGFSLVTGAGAVTYGQYTAAGTGTSIAGSPASTGNGAVTYGAFIAAGTGTSLPGEVPEEPARGGGGFYIPDRDLERIRDAMANRGRGKVRYGRPIAAGTGETFAAVPLDWGAAPPPPPEPEAPPPPPPPPVVWEGHGWVSLRRPTAKGSASITKIPWSAEDDLDALTLILMEGAA